MDIPDAPAKGSGLGWLRAVDGLHLRSDGRRVPLSELSDDERNRLASAAALVTAGAVAAELGKKAVEVTRRTKHVYIREEDRQVWARAEKLAGRSFSALLGEALRRYVRLREIEQQRMERIVIEVTDIQAGRRHRKAFVGRWLISPDEQARSEREGQDGVMAGLVYAVARTAKDQIAVYVVHRTDPSRVNWFRVYASMDDAVHDLPADIAARAANELDDPDNAEELDI